MSTTTNSVDVSKFPPVVWTKEIPLDQIDFDLKWNGRYGLGDSTGTGEDQETSTVEDIVNSWEDRGQDTAIVVRPNPDKKAAKPYILAAGFRRREARQRLAERRKEKTPTIRADYREMNEAEAIEFNAAENLIRSQLDIADTCVLVCRMQEQNANLTEKELGKKIGKSPSYINKMLVIGRNVKKTILEHWRAAPKKVPMMAMLEVAKKPKAEQDALYQSYAGSSSQEGEATASDKWIKNCKERAKEVGEHFGFLHGRELIEVSDPDVLFHVDNVRYLVKGIKKTATEKQVQSVCDVAVKAFSKGVDRGEQGDEAEEGEEEAAE